MCDRVPHTASLPGSCWHRIVSCLHAEDSNSHHHSKVHCGGHRHLTYSGIARMSKLRGHSMGTFSVPNTHLLGELGHTPAMKIFVKLYTLKSLLRLLLATNTILSVLPVCSLHIHMKVIAHANNWSLTLAFHIIFTRAPVNFMRVQAWYAWV